MISALFVDTKRGPYPTLGVDCWGEKRDARNFTGDGPVIVHPPCARWCGMARLNERKYGCKVGDDDGLFAFALATLRRCGGVLEHPAFSLAWPAFNLARPPKFPGGWGQVGEREWVCEVHQVAYGHEARKKTWLVYVGDTPPAELNWASPEPVAQVGGGVNTGNRNRPRIGSGKSHLTPEPFARALIALAEGARSPRPRPQGAGERT